MNDCIFCKIVKGEIPSARVWEDENFVAFLSIKPINPGHTLIIPKKHIDYFFDLDDETLCALMKSTKPLAKALREAFRPARNKIGVMVSGGEVPHVHVHLIPMDNEGDLTFERAKDASFDEIQKNAAKIKAALQS